MCAPVSAERGQPPFTLTEPIYVKEWPVDRPGMPGLRHYGISGGLRARGAAAAGDLPGGHRPLRVNDGYNAGMAVHYSGTGRGHGGGALNHLPAMAVSIHHHADQGHDRSSGALCCACGGKSCPRRYAAHTVLNINAPLCAGKAAPGACAADAGNFIDGYERRQSPRAGTYFWLLEGSKNREPPAGGGTDLYYLWPAISRRLWQPRQPRQACV